MASTVAHPTGLLYGIRLQTQTGVEQDLWTNERSAEHRSTLTRLREAIAGVA